MPKRVFIIHGWGGYTDEGCFPWLKVELEKSGFKVAIPAMPDPLNPTIKVWVEFLKKQIGVPDKDTILLGHSIGAQTILRYLELLPEGTKIGGAVFLAGWIHLTSEAYEDENDREIGKPWLETPIDWRKVKSHTNQFIAIFSDNDPLVPISDAEVFRHKLGAKTMVEHGKGHFSGSDGITELPFALAAVLEMAKIG